MIISILLICLTSLPVHAGMPVSLDQVEPKLIDEQANEELKKKGEEERRQQEIQRQADEVRRREESWRKEEDQRQRERNKAEYSSNNESSKSGQWDWSNPDVKNMPKWLHSTIGLGIILFFLVSGAGSQGK